MVKAETARATEVTSCGSAGWPVAMPVAFTVDEQAVDEDTVDEKILWPLLFRLCQFLR
jgi:hypothetical protein